MFLFNFVLLFCCICSLICVLIARMFCRLILFKCSFIFLFLEQIHNGQNDYLHAISDEDDHYSQVDDENPQNRPNLPSRKVAAQAAVNRPQSKESTRITDKYLTPVTKNTNCKENEPEAQGHENNNKMSTTDTNDTENHDRIVMSKIDTASI